MTSLPRALSIIEATKMAHQTFHENLFLGSDLSVTEKKRALNVIQDPIWRPLCELEVNGATSYEGALLLLSFELIRVSPFLVRQGDSAGSSVHCVELTDKGQQLFSEFAGQHYDLDLRGKLIDSLMCYAAVDMGNGIVARRSAMESAIDIGDGGYLKRLRSITMGNYLFGEFETKSQITDIERGESLEFVSSWDGERIGSGILDLAIGSD